MNLSECLCNRCSDQLRSILADVEMRLMEAVDELVSHFTTRTSDHSDQTSNSCQHPSPSATHGDATETQTAQCVHFLFIALLSHPNIRVHLHD